jgi:hypothetical protein
MNTQPTGFFNESINNMDASSKLPFFPKDFIGRLRVDVCKGITTRKGERAYIVEFTVLTSNLDTVYVGGRYSWYQSLKEQDTAYPSCVAFLYACLGLDPARDRTKIDKEVKPKQNVWLDQSVNDDATKGPVQILVGSEIMLQTAIKKVKEAKMMTLEEAEKLGKVFTLHSFSPAPAATDTAATAA